MLLSSLIAYADTGASQNPIENEWKSVSDGSSRCFELAQTQDGSIIAAFQDGLWEKANNSDWVRIGEFSFSDKKGGMAISKTGEIAVISGKKVLQYKNGSWSTIKDFSSENDSFKSLKYDISGNLLIGTSRGKVLELKNGILEQIGQFEEKLINGGGLDFVSSPPNSETPTIVIDVPHRESGHVKSKSSDVLQYTDGKWKTIGSFDDRYISAITFGQDGMPIVALTSRMVGQAGESVLKYNGSEWIKLGENTPNNAGDKISGHHIIQMELDQDGTLLAVTRDDFGSKLWKYKDKTWSVFEDIKNLDTNGYDDKFTSLSIGLNNEILVGTLFSGIWQYASPEPGVVEPKNAEAELPIQKGAGSAKTAIAIIVLIVLCAGFWLLLKKRK